MLENEFNYYLDHQTELLPQYNGKYVVVVGNQVVGAYDDAEHAVHFSRKKYQPGTFLIQLCTPGNSAYTVRACSRMIV